MCDAVSLSETPVCRGRLRPVVHKQAAVDNLQNALRYWDEIIKVTRPIYKNMRLTHYNHNFFTANDDNWFHWALIRDEVAADVAIAEKL